jgi:hypothetical protein
VIPRLTNSRQMWPYFDCVLMWLVLALEAYARRFHNSGGPAMVDRTNTPSPVRDRKFSITSALSIAAHTEGTTPIIAWPVAWFI